MNFSIRLHGQYQGRGMHKLLLIMKLVIIFMTIGILQVSASGFAQKITMSRTNAPLHQVIKEIRRQSGYDFILNKDLLAKARPVTINVKNADLHDVLDACFEDQPLTYSIEDKAVILKAKAQSFTEVIKEKVVPFFQDSILYKGRVLDERGLPLPGATIYLKGATKGSISREDGYFERYGTKKGTLIVRYVGYLNKEISLAGIDPAEQILIKMIPGLEQLGEVNVVSTGYYNLEKERATGSFEVITKEMLLHSNNPNLLKRLEGITTSINFNNQLLPNLSTNPTFKGINAPSRLNYMTIRGKNTMVPTVAVTTGNSGGIPLVVIDGIASPYSIDQIDPNNIETVTLLKDAASASIWGSRAANGVIVITTKKGSYKKPLNISFNSNINITEKIDLFYKKKMSASEFIDAQIFLYNSRYNPSDPNAYIPAPDVSLAQRGISPVEEILNLQKTNKITADQANLQLDALRGNDVKKDLEQFIIRKAIDQNYTLGIDGGTEKFAYRLFGAYNTTLNNTVGSSQNRLNLNYGTSIQPVKNLEISANLVFSKSTTSDQSSSQYISGLDNDFYPYTRLVDAQGNPSSIPFKYRPLFLDLLRSTYGNAIQDLSYNPLENMKQGYFKANLQTVNINASVKYKFNDIFSANVSYNYAIGYNEQNNLDRKDSYYTRSLITLYTSPYSLTSRIPAGGIYQTTISKVNNQTLRGQLNANKEWNGKHVLSALIGIDANQTYGTSKADQYYGYDESLMRTNPIVDYKDYDFLLFADDLTGLGFGRPQINTSLNFNRQRSYGLFGNAAYTYNRRYTVSGSIRKDGNSQFGAGTNKGGTPFYSAGLSWNIANEDFYSVTWLPSLQLRATFGYNGNVNPTVSAIPLISYSTDPDFITGNYYANTVDNAGASNRLLRPEKTRQLNLGVDFGFLNGRLSGSIEYYDKKTSDLIRTGPLDPSTGFFVQQYNVAGLHSWGSDLRLNSQNLKLGLFSWNSNFLFSHNRVKVSKLFVNTAQNVNAIVSNQAGFELGKDLSRLYAYRWAGLDPSTGDPRGYLNGNVVSISGSSAGLDRMAEMGKEPVSSLRYFGSSIPVYFGSFGNTFNYGRLSASFNFLYKLGYYFRRPPSDIVYYSNLPQNTLQGGEYSKRWQKSGDELTTNVPSFTYPTANHRDLFYFNSEINVQKGDHIRLQEVNLSYAFASKKFIKNPRFYINMPLNVIVWRANKLGLDPDIQDFPNPRTYGFGFSANF